MKSHPMTRFLLILSAITAAVFAQTPKENLQRNIGTNTIAGTNAAAPFKVETIAALKAIVGTGRFNGQQVELAGYYAAGDGGGGVFQYDSSSSAADNGGTIIAPNAGGTGRWLRVVGSRVDARQFGARWNNTTDDQPYLQAAITYLASIGGGQISLPGGTARIAAPIIFPGSEKQIGMYGDAAFSTILRADFTSASATAVIKAVGTQGARCYVNLENFRVSGTNSANIHGIFMEWTNPYSTVTNVIINGFVDGLRISTSYETRLTGVTSILNTNNGISIGLNLAGADSICNVTNIRGCTTQSNGNYGIFLNGGRNIIVSGSNVEGNTVAGLYAINARAIEVGACYSEGSLVTHNTTAQYAFEACFAVVFNACNVSNWFPGTTLLLVSNTNGMNISGFNCERGTGVTTTLAGNGITITESQGVTISGCVLENIATGINVTANARVSVDMTRFNYVTTPVRFPNESFSVLVWTGAYDADVAASSIGADAQFFSITQNNGVNLRNYSLSKNFKVGAYVDMDTTPSVANGITAMRLVPSSPVSITNFDDGVAGQELTLIFDNGNSTIVHGSILLVGGVNYTPNQYDTLRLYCASPGDWRELGRSTL